MTDIDLIKELDDIISKLKMRLIYYKTENSKLKKTITDLKDFVRTK
jgi:hypothetical protein